MLEISYLFCIFYIRLRAFGNLGYFQPFKIIMRSKKGRELGLLHLPQTFLLEIIWVYTRPYHQKIPDRSIHQMDLHIE